MEVSTVFGRAAKAEVAARLTAKAEVAARLTGKDFVKEPEEEEQEQVKE